MRKLRSVTPISEGKEQALLRFHGKLLKWALDLTNNERSTAEDLVHDVFVQFTLGCDPAKIKNLEGYLYTMLRNLHLARVRQAAQHRNVDLSVIEYESAEVSLRAADELRVRLQIQDDLRQVCQYACYRKQASTTGSALILRFFHGYYPSEIALLMGCSRHAVEERLRVARCEAKQFLEGREPSVCTGIPAQTAEGLRGRQCCASPDSFILLLRALIFDSKTGTCLSSDKLHFIYGGGKRTDKVDCEFLAHLASCARCLDLANSILGLPSLAERYPADRLGPESRPKGDAGGSDFPPTQGGSAAAALDTSEEVLRRHHRESRRVFRHHPKELRVSVNGFTLGVQRVGASVNELSLHVKGEEQIGFIEVLSEQRVRLLLLNATPPPTGELEQTATVELSEGRVLQLTLSFANPWPAIHVVYRDPRPAAEHAEQATPCSPTEARILSVQGPMRDKACTKPLRFPVFNGMSQWWSWLVGRPSWRRPVVVSALLVLVVIAATVLVQKRVSVAPAAELLRRSALAERALVADRVVHRTIALEEKSDSGQVLARRKIEVWHSAKLGRAGRRYFSEQNRLVAGEWSRPDGSRTLYQRGSKRNLTPTEQNPVPLDFDDMWRVELSAAQFSSLVPVTAAAEVEQSESAYVIAYSRGNEDRGPGLLRAELVLARSNLHATAQTMIVRQDNETREFRFIETSFEQQTLNEVEPSVFEPDSTLLDSGTSGAPQARSQTLAPVYATADLEVEALRFLSDVGADLGEQIKVERTRSGRVRVEGIVESEQRKSEILQALSPLTTNPAVQLKLSTVAEALAAVQSKAAQSSPAPVDSLTPSSNSIPVEQELRRYFISQGVPNERLDQEVSSFATRVLDGALRALEHAQAIQRLTQHFTPDELHELHLEAKTGWLAMIRRHAESVEQEMTDMGREISLIFPAATTAAEEGQAPTSIGNLGDLSNAADHLVELCSASDRLVGSAFALSPQRSATPDLNSPRSWVSVTAAKVLSQGIRTTAQKLEIAATNGRRR